jgi:ubiquinone/menaquinone biosynthesis C-methylase UbiE
MELMFAFYERLERKAPGSASSTRKALSLLPGLPPKPRVADFGCGSGVATLVLAEATGGEVTAVDIHQPFLDRLEARAARAGISDRVRTLQADMADPPLGDGSFDLVWSEGAIYLMGLEAGLNRWRRLLQPEGYLAVTEVAWLTRQPPARAAEFWAAEYPGIATIDEHLATFRRARFEPVSHFVLPAEDWERYYSPLQVELEQFRSSHEGDRDAEAFAADLDREVAMWREYGDSYGYVFFLAQVS